MWVVNTGKRWKKELGNEGKEIKAWVKVYYGPLFMEATSFSPHGHTECGTLHGAGFGVKIILIQSQFAAWQLHLKPKLGPLPFHHAPSLSGSEDEGSEKVTNVLTQRSTHTAEKNCSGKGKWVMKKTVYFSLFQGFTSVYALHSWALCGKRLCNIM